ncbi:MAG: DNRLRE domain-containing protein, partial [Anaerolineae bacterium]|nr:DNRLRE domain-containing protein [Anaerolineae bacterium]
MSIQAARPLSMNVHDTYVSAVDPGHPHDADPVLSISPQSVVLLRFDLGQVPPEADVLQATLSLWVDSRSQPLPMEVVAHVLTQPWRDGATWLEAAPGLPWGKPGAAGDADRGDVLGRQMLEDVGRWYEWDVTSAVRQWLTRPAREAQMLLAAKGPDVVYYLASSEWRDAALHPRLTVRYRVGSLAQASEGEETPLSYGKEFLPTIPYIMYDWRNRNWQGEAPQRGPIGSHIEFTWEDVNPAPGRFDWSRYDEYLRAARTQYVTLPDGTSIPKPVMFTLMLAGSDQDGRFHDFTPTWVYEEIGGRPELDGRPVGYVVQPGKCNPAAVPLYDDPRWQAALAELIAAFGARYDGDPQVAGIWIGAGLDDETQPTKAVGSCDYPAELERSLGCEAYMAFLERLMGWYAAAFPHKPLWIQAAPGACAGKSGAWSRRRIMARAAALGIGYKANALQPDMTTAIGYLNSAGWQIMDIADRYAGQIPIAFEPAYSAPVGEDDPVEYAYWMVYNALAHHATFVDLQPEWVDDLDQVPEVWSAMQDSLGRTAADAPAVWIILRDAECEPVMWPSSGNSCEPGDWDFYLRRLEKAPGNHTVALREADLPPQAAAQPYGRHARRTDEAHGNQFMSFDVDDRWQFAGQLPVASGGRARYEVDVWYLDWGNDSWYLEYNDSQGELHQVQVVKEDTRRWRKASWTLNDLFLGNALPGGADLRLNSAGDGDDVFHKVVVRGTWVTPAEPTPSPTLAPTGGPTEQPVPTVVLKPSPVASTATPSPPLLPTPSEENTTQP